MAALVAAVVWANGPWGHTYAAVWEHPAALPGHLAPDLATVRDWVNGGLMAVFFLAVGLEIGRERRHGELADLRTAVVPVAGAAGGMAATGLLYALVVHGGVGARGWGIPMATDIAFALGALAALGRLVPPGLRLLLLTLAVADDIGSVLVLAAFYTRPSHPAALVGAAVVVVALVVVCRAAGPPAAAVLAVGVVLWALLAVGGVEPALAGVVAGVLVTDRPRRGPTAARVERWVAPASALLVLPVFALANAGITVHRGLLAPAGAITVVVAIVVARVVGKLVGITGACLVVVRAGWGRLPAGVRWRHVAGGAAIAGIGFTVPLLVAEQAFPGNGPLVVAAELGLVGGSVLAVALGAAILRWAGRSPARAGTGLP